MVKWLLLKQMGNELVETATPGEELMAGAFGDGGVDLDAKLTQTVDDGLTLDEVIATPVHIHIVVIRLRLLVTIRLQLPWQMGKQSQGHGEQPILWALLAATQNHTVSL